MENEEKNDMIEKKRRERDLADYRRLQTEEKENNIKLGTDEILGMVVFDRSVDFLTLMTTNNTCEGLIDENIGINLGKIKVKNSLLNSNVPSKIK